MEWKMEMITGKSTSEINEVEFKHKIEQYAHVSIDIGTGDGQFVLHQARSEPGGFYIGIDACRENLVQSARRAPANALFIIANALCLPGELAQTAGRLTINFPWGSLLEGLLAPHADLLGGLACLAKHGAALEVRLNSGALAEAGCYLAEGSLRIHSSLELAGFRVSTPRHIDSLGLRACPTTWAKRLAFGRSPEAVLLSGRR
jgi:16S rRNA (adenine(1408)-N(1))-methyltransferase